MEIDKTKQFIEKYGLLYNLSSEEVEKYLPICNEFDLHIYDVKSLFDKYKNPQYVLQNIKEGNFLSKTEKWLQGDYKFNTPDNFKERAITFSTKRKYVDLYPNKHPESEYMKFWKEEIRRCIYGYYVNGDWITGYHYFYLNYCPIELTRVLEDSTLFKNKKQLKGERVLDFPYFWDGDYFFFHYLEEAERLGLSAVCLKTRGRGYQMPDSQLIRMSNGTTKPIGELIIGDKILGRTGKETSVLEIFLQGEDDVYEVELHDGRKLRCGKEHLWSVYDKTKKGKNRNKLVTYKLEDIINKGLYYTSKNNNKLYKFYVPDINEVEYESKILPIDPYLLGLLLGDGSLSTGSIKLATSDKEIIDKVQSILGDKYNLIYDNTTTNNYRIVIKDEYLRPDGFKLENPLKTEILKLKLNITCKDKFIPDIYKLSSIEQRLELVRGLMDTDGYISKDGSMEFTNTSYKLIKDLEEVLRSLGIACSIGIDDRVGKKTIYKNREIIKKQISYRLYIRTNKILFNLSRKIKRIKNDKFIYKNTSIINIKKLDYKELSRCIMVDNEEHLYLTDNYIPTHNSWKGASMADRNFFLIPKSKSIIVAETSEYLTGADAITTKAWSQMAFIDEHTPWAKKRQKKDTDTHKRASMEKIVNGVKIETGYLSEITAISLKDDIDKARGKRSKLIIYEEAGSFKDLVSAWIVTKPSIVQGNTTHGLRLAFGCVCAGTKVWTNKGKLINIEDVYNLQRDGILGYDGNDIYKEEIEWYREPHIKPCYKIRTSGNNYIECSEDHPILMYKSNNNKRKENKIIGKFVTFTEACKLKKGDRLLMIDEVSIFGNKNIPDARLYGLMIGDGNMSNGSTPQLSCGDIEVYDYIKEKYNYKVYKSFIQKSHKEKLYMSIGIKDMKDKFKENGLYGKVKMNKTLPNDIDKYNKESVCELLGGYFDADGYVKYRKDKDRVIIVLTSISESLLNEVKYLLYKLGIHGVIQKEHRKRGYVDNSYIYRLYISNKTDTIRFQKHIKFLCKEKQNTLNKVLEYKDKTDRSRPIGFFKLNKENNKGKYFVGKEYMNNMYSESIKSIEYIGEKEVYNLHTEHTNTYIANSYITKQTGGEEGKGFEGLKKLFYNPKVYDVYGINDVWTPGNKKQIVSWFQPEYVNREGFYDDNGNSNMDNAKEYILEERDQLVASGADSETILRVKAEQPMLPEDALLRTSGSPFPRTAIKERLNLLEKDNNYFTKRGRLLISSEGKVIWMEDSTVNIIEEHTPSKKNAEGGIEIYQDPIDTLKEQPFSYIIGVDPIDFDYDEVGNDYSLGSAFVMNTITEQIVAEYTGRPNLADDFYENVRRLAIYYNAKVMHENNIKGIVTYFKNNYSEYLLALSPKILDNSATILSSGNRKYGYTATESVNKLALQLIKKWLNTKINNQTELTFLHTIYSKGLLNELLEWFPGGNFDRVSAMIATMIFRQDIDRLVKSYTDDRDKNDENKFWLKPFKKK